MAINKGEIKFLLDEFPGNSIVVVETLEKEGIDVPANKIQEGCLAGPYVRIEDLCDADLVTHLRACKNKFIRGIGIIDRILDGSG